MYKCANCDMSLLDLKETTPSGERPAIDDLLVCGNCGRISVVTLLTTRLLTEEEFAALDDDEKRDLLFAIRASQRPIQNANNSNRRH